MGGCRNQELRVDFNRRLKLKFLVGEVATAAGMPAYRERDEALGLTEKRAEVPTDSRQGSNQRHQLLPLLRQSGLSRWAGHEDVNDAERLYLDRVMRHVVGGRAASSENHAASAGEVGRFETESLGTRRNLTTLMNLSGRWVDAVHRRQPLKQLIPDPDSSVSETDGRQQGTQLSCRRFKDNQTRLQLFALVDDLGNFLRRPALPKPVRNGSLTTLREKRIKIAAKVTRHSKYVTFCLAEVAVTRNSFTGILNRIAERAIPPPVLVGGMTVSGQDGDEKEAGPKEKTLRDVRGQGRKTAVSISKPVVGNRGLESG